ncbi:MAG: diaminopimelate epimerase [Defluviitaleaceae bacterium]|nr:diaminopimelate epimerase [Defluviitaleaceae bacterium]
MKVKKYDGCGNTFAIIDAATHMDLAALAPRLCEDPRLKTDGLIAVGRDPLEMRFYNRDGSFAPMCGNGIRCFAKYVRDEGHVSVETRTFDVLTGAGVLSVDIIQDDPFLCRIAMGQPIFTSEAVGLADEGPLSRTLHIDDQTVDIHALFMGTIHVVVFVKDAPAMVGSPLGKAICEHPLFEAKTNVNFVQVVGSSELIVRTYERGVGWTLACGTGCCASYVVAKQLGYVTADQVDVLLEQGKLMIAGVNEIEMTGPAVVHHTIEIDQKELI